MISKVCSFCNITFDKKEKFCKSSGKSFKQLFSGRLPWVNTELKKSCSGLTIMEALLVLLVVGALVAIVVPTRPKSSRLHGKRACQFNVRVITGAVELYNQDRADPDKHITTELDDPTKDDSIFIKEKYLKSPVIPPEKGCYYRIIGDMSKKGTVSCDLHGTVEDPQ